MIRSTLRSIPEGKNFGFICGTKKNQDYFFHRDDFNGFWDDLLYDLRNGVNIVLEFEAQDSPKGLRAVRVSRVGFPNEG